MIPLKQLKELKHTVDQAYLNLPSINADKLVIFNNDMALLLALEIVDKNDDMTRLFNDWWQQFYHGKIDADSTYDLEMDEMVLNNTFHGYYRMLYFAKHGITNKVLNRLNKISSH